MKFETDSDLANEKKIADYLAKIYGYVEYEKAGEGESIDYKFYRYSIQRNGNKAESKKRLHLVAEIKCRDIASDQYPTVIISSRKRDELLAYEADAVMAALVIAFKKDKKIGMIFAEDMIGLPKELGGRTVQTREGAPNDTEEIIHIPIDPSKGFHLIYP